MPKDTQLRDFGRPKSELSLPGSQPPALQSPPGSGRLGSASLPGKEAGSCVWEAAPGTEGQRLLPPLFPLHSSWPFSAFADAPLADAPGSVGGHVGAVSPAERPQLALLSPYQMTPFLGALEWEK